MGGGGCGASAKEYICAHGAKINFEDLTPYLTYGSTCYMLILWTWVKPVSKTECGLSGVNFTLELFCGGSAYPVLEFLNNLWGPGTNRKRVVVQVRPAT
jgi:hypothetical protein